MGFLKIFCWLGDGGENFAKRSPLHQPLRDSSLNGRAFSSQKTQIAPSNTVIFLFSKVFVEVWNHFFQKGVPKKEKNCEKYLTKGVKSVYNSKRRRKTGGRSRRNPY